MSKTKPRLSDVKRLALTLKATLENSTNYSAPAARREHCYYITAPTGKQWESSGGLHTLAMIWVGTSAEDEQAAANDALTRMKNGLMICPDDCECR